MARPHVAPNVDRTPINIRPRRIQVTKKLIQTIPNSRPSNHGKEQCNVFSNARHRATAHGYAAGVFARMRRRLDQARAPWGAELAGGRHQVHRHGTLISRVRVSLRVIAALAGTIVVTAQVLAQDRGRDRYTVEILVFRHATQLDDYYRWPGEPETDRCVELPASPPPLAQELTFLNLPLDTAPSPLRPNMNRLGFESLESDRLQLHNAWNELQRHPAYVPILHLGWGQPASPFGEPQPVRIRGGQIIFQPNTIVTFPADTDDDVHEIDGSVAIERGRYLHLRIDLALHRIVDPSNRPPSPTLSSQVRYPGVRYHTYRLTERRQIRDQSMNYFDHRQFGIIAIVTEWEPRP